MPKPEQIRYERPWGNEIVVCEYDEDGCVLVSRESMESLLVRAGFGLAKPVDAEVVESDA